MRHYVLSGGSRYGDKYIILLILSQAHSRGAAQSPNQMRCKQVQGQSEEMPLILGIHQPSRADGRWIARLPLMPPDRTDVIQNIPGHRLIRGAHDQRVGLWRCDFRVNLDTACFDGY